MYLIVSIAFVTIITGSYLYHEYRKERKRMNDELWNARMDAWDKERFIREQQKIIFDLKRKLHDNNY